LGGDFMFDTCDTIAAVASPRDPALRGILRISGPQSVALVKRIFTPAAGENIDELASPSVIIGTIRADVPLGEIPCELYVWPTQFSYTRQPCVEIHSIGSAPLLDGLLAAVCRTGARLARPGEFTLRAFLAGRLDLTQAEAVLGVIDSRDARELDAALRQLAGGLSRPLNDLRNQLLDLLAHLEAGLDFVEEDIAFISVGEVDCRLSQLHNAIEELVRQVTDRAQPSGEPRVVLVGCPNVGKSSLFNALCQSARAIVAGTPGTTRDYVTHRLLVSGRHVQLVDTAGIETDSGNDAIAAASQQASLEQSREASLRLLCLDATRRMNAWERSELSNSPPQGRVIVLTKCDQPRHCDFSGNGIATSSWTGEGLVELSEVIAESVAESPACDDQVIASTAARCHDSLRSAAESVQRARELHRRQSRIGMPARDVAGGNEELVAAELRTSLDELGLVVGAVHTDDILDRVFSRFCIGK
jgi:tRNA modification GTPase